MATSVGINDVGPHEAQNGDKIPYATTIPLRALGPQALTLNPRNPKTWAIKVGAVIRRAESCGFLGRTFQYSTL